MNTIFRNTRAAVLLLTLVCCSCVDRDLAMHRKSVAELGPDTTRKELAAVLPPAGPREVMTVLGRTEGMAVKERYRTQGGFMVQYDCWYPYRKPADKWTSKEIDEFISVNRPARDFLAKPDPNGRIHKIEVRRLTGKEDTPLFSRIPDSWL